MTVKAQDTTTYILTQFSDEDDGDDLLFKSKHGVSGLNILIIRVTDLPSSVCI